jgi:beta-mannosidase
MKRISLNGKWSMTGAGYSCFGNIPGSVYSFLHIDNEILPDPFFRDNEDIYLALAEEEFAFERQFEHKNTGNSVFLVFEGLDTLCSVYLNGNLVAETENMHLKYSFDVSESLKNGANTLKVVCHPIAPYMREKNAQAKLFGSVDCMEGYPYIRKAHSMMGWDWGPRLPDAGIWRSVYLVE